MTDDQLHANAHARLQEDDTTWNELDTTWACDHPQTAAADRRRLMHARYVKDLRDHLKFHHRHHPGSFSLDELVHLHTRLSRATADAE
jgi:hypothetical protein